MQAKHLFLATAFTSLLVTATYAQSPTGKTSPAETSSRRVQQTAPVIHRQANLPVDRVDQGKKPGKLTEARSAAHFDTTGEKSESNGVTNRLRQIRTAKVYEELKPVEKPEKQTLRRTKTSKAKVESSPSDTSSPVTAKVADETDENETTTVANAAKPSESVATETDSDSTATPQPVSTTAPVQNLPSVMQKPTVQHDTSQESTARVVPRDSSDNEPASSTDGFSENRSSDRTEKVTAVPKAQASETATVGPSQTDENLLITNRSPVLSVTTRGPRTIVVGKEALFEFELRNASEIAAKDVIVRMHLPHWIEVAKQDTSVGSTRIEPDEQGDSTLSWTISHLNGEAHENLKLKIIPRGSRPLDLGVTWTFLPANTTAQIQVQEPKLEMSVIGPQDVLFGETKIYTLTISNPGTGDAENVVLNLMPLVPSEQAAGVRQIGTIRAGTRRTIEVELTARQTGRLQVRAEAVADNGLRVQGVQDVLVRRAALEVQVKAPPMKYAGTKARYSIQVTNSGDTTARDVVAIATLPAGADNIASSSGGRLDTNHGQVHWRLGSIRPGASRVFELECTLVSPGTNRLDMRAVAHGDVNALSSAVTVVESLADLKMTVDDPHGAVGVDADVIYEVKIENRGTKAASNIQLYGFFSEGIEPAGIRGWRGSISEGEVIIERIPRLGPGQEMVIKITAQAHRPGDHVFRAELESVDPETKLAVEEWTRFFGETETAQQVNREEVAEQR